MTRLVQSRALASSIATDAANRQMRKAGRSKWSKADYNEATRTFARVWPLEAEYPWATPAQIATMKTQLGY